MYKIACSATVGFKSVYIYCQGSCTIGCCSTGGTSCFSNDDDTTVTYSTDECKYTNDIDSGSGDSSDSDGTVPFTSNVTDETSDASDSSDDSDSGNYGEIHIMFKMVRLVIVCLCFVFTV